MRGVTAIAVAATLMCNSCALFNPYVQARDPDTKKPVLPTIEHVEFVGGIDEAVRHADLWRTTYIQAASTHSAARNVTAAAILPITAVSLFYGIRDHGSADRITRMALGSATLYAGNEFLTSKPRQELYLLGARSLTCAIVASRPYMVSREWATSFDSKKNKFNNRLAALEIANAALLGQLSIAEKEAKSNAERRRLEAAARIYSGAEKAIEDGRALAKQAGILSLDFEQSGHVLLGAVRAINDRVNQELPKTEPNLETLKSLSFGMEGLAKGLVATAWPKAPEEVPEDSDQNRGPPAFAGLNGAPSQGDSLRSASDAVINAQASLAGKGVLLRSDIQSIAALGEASIQLPECIPKDVSMPFTVMPSSEILTISKGKFAIVSAEGGAGIPGYQISGANADAVTITASSQKVSQLSLIVAGDQKVPASNGPTLTITDGSGYQRRSIKLEVVD